MNQNPYNTPEAKPNTEITKKGIIESFLLSFLRHWNGRAKLATAFWGHFILGNFLFTLVFALTIRGMNALSIDASAIQIALGVLGLIYYFCTVRFIWACAPNTKHSGLFYIARGLILAALIFIVAIFAITGYEVIGNL